MPNKADDLYNSIKDEASIQDVLLKLIQKLMRHPKITNVQRKKLAELRAHVDIHLKDI